MNEERVQERLRELRESMVNLNAPEGVETAVMAAFRERRPERTLRFAPVWQWAAAACLALMALLAFWRLQPERRDVAGELRRPPAPAAPVVAPAVAPAPLNVVVARRSRPARVERLQRPAEEPPQAGESGAAFVALPYAPPVIPTEDQHLVRVRLPRGAMRQFGMIVREDRVREPVQADFLLGQDGVARAVRLVHSAQ